MRTPLPAIGLVHRPAGAPALDRSWARALVIRHARDIGAQLVDVLELDDDLARTRDLLDRARLLAATTAAAVLVTDGVDPRFAAGLAAELGLRHAPVSPRYRPSD